jgi:hypothetical protein
MHVFAFHNSILLMSMWTGNDMMYANTLEKRIQGLVLPSLIGLYGLTFFIKLALN